jgi:hypothetical protein
VKRFTAEHADAGTYTATVTPGARTEAVIALLRALAPGDKLTVVRTA